jgi:hypothetical protein
LKIVIKTQYRENYGSHDWDGVGSCPQYWKNKGGYTYVVEGVSPEKAQELTLEDVKEISSLITYSSNFSEEYIIMHSIQDDDSVICEDWETPIFMSKENNAWIARSVTKNDEYGYMNQKISEKHESYTMLVGGGRKNYSSSFLLKNGEMVSNENLATYLTNQCEMV